MPCARQVSALLALGWTGLALCGCQKTDTATNTETSTATNTTAATNTASTGTASGSGGKKYKIVYIPKNTGNPYFEAVITGFKKASDESGFEFTSVAPAQAGAAAQIPFIQQQVQRGVDAIAITPDSPDAPAPALKAAMAKGIKVITLDADLEKNEDARNASVAQTDPDLVGKSQIDLLSSLIGGKGDIAILSATTDAPNQNHWIAGMKEALKDPKYKGMNLVDVVYGDDVNEKSQRETAGLLSKYPNLKGIISPTTVGIAAAASALETAHAAGRVQLTGLGTPNQMRRFIKNGTVKKFALWNPADMGYLTSQLILAMLKDGVKPDSGVSIKAGTLGTRKFGAKNTVITEPLVVFDKDNIDKYHF